MAPPTRLALFDIDGTLVDCHAQTRETLREAFEEGFGTAGAIDEYDFAGKTDHQIVHDLIGAAGRSADEIDADLERVRRLYCELLERRLSARRMRLLPGVRELLAALEGRGDTVLGLITGNWEASGRTKLARFGIDRHFGFGAFGEGQRDRLGLAPLALRRAREATGRRFRPGEAVIVGDTVLDVACGRAHGVPVLGVATGRTPAAELAAAGADWVLPDLADAADHPAFAGAAGGRS